MKKFLRRKIQRVMCIRLQFRCSIDYKRKRWIKMFWILLIGIIIVSCVLKEEELHSSYHSFRFAQGTNKLWKMLCPSSLWFIILVYSSRYGKIAVKNSDGTVKMYQAAKKYFEALKSASSDKDLEVLKEKLDVLQGI